MADDRQTIRRDRAHISAADESFDDCTRLLQLLLWISETRDVQSLRRHSSHAVRMTLADIERLVNAGCLSRRKHYHDGPLELTEVGASICEIGIRAIRDQLNGASPIIPHWDATTQLLSYNGRPIKQFRKAAPNQERLLTAFQVRGWPKPVADPLPRDNGIIPQRRLRDTIKRLIRSIDTSVLQFGGDGTGSGVRWLIQSNAKVFSENATIAPNRT